MSRLYIPTCILFSLIFTLLGTKLRAQEKDDRPNILLIVADDLGFTDLGAFGSEIKTPNLDSLALSGLRFGSFYAAPTCSPTRAMLLSGTDNHIAGLGEMEEFSTPEIRRNPGYEGYLNDNVHSVANILLENGYHTYMSGKWHLGFDESQSPKSRGFERSFALLEGGGSHFDSSGPIEAQAIVRYREDTGLTNIPDDFYSSEFYASKLIEFLESQGDSAPFFAYLAFTAPHWPLHAPEEDIKKYRGKYDKGYEHLRKQRFQAAKRLGLFESKSMLPPPSVPVTGWSDLSTEEKIRSSRKMEVYAAMITNMDHQIGRVLKALDSQGRLNSTIVVFLSDNGADGMQLETMPLFKDWVSRFDNRTDNIGRKGSFVSYGQAWALASTAGLKHFKAQTTEGGIRVPAFITGAPISADYTGKISTEFATVKDITPTLLDFAGIDLTPFKTDASGLAPIQGASLVPFLAAQTSTISNQRDAMGWELGGRSALRDGDWKIIKLPHPFGNGRWQLYNLINDPFESSDLADENPSTLNSMINLWKAYVDKNGVIDLNTH